ncbi:hypothetical protein [Halomonas sp. MCCC 1A11062]|nr:hypothetical protein [Halomonas sp. MCCC 1A11062]
MPRSWIARLGLLLALLLLTVACEAEPRRYDFTVQPFGGGQFG